jgi:hypothetical protein
MKKKQQTITDILGQKFSPAEMSFVKFKEAASGTETIMRLGVRNILNRLNAFDEEEYDKALRQDSSGKAAQQRKTLFEEYAFFINQTMENNDDILIKLDRLILELTKLSDSADLNEIDALQEIDKLINDAKWYK